MSLDIITYSKLKAVVKQLTQTIADSVYVHPTGDGNKHVPSTAEVLEGTPTTWDPLAKHASAVLSNGNLTVSSGIAQWCGARATVSKATGKYYFEVLVNAIDSVSVGICTATSDFSFVGNSGSSGGVLSNGGEVFFTGGSPSYGDPLWVDGDVIGVAVDMDATSVICYLNNVQIASNNFDPSKSPIFPMVACVNNGVATGRFTAADLTYSPPAGYTAWGDETVIPDANEGKVLTAGAELGEVSWQALPVASESAAGVIELATAAEAVAGTDMARAVTPAGLSAGLDARTLGLLNIASLPAHYERSDKWANGGSDTDANRRTLVSPSRLTVNVNDIGYLLPTAVSMDINTATNWDSTATDYTVAANRAGKDFYIYACTPVSGTAPKILLSANSTVPTGYLATTSRKIGGFHCLCVAVGTIAGHTLTGYLAGDILPATVWDIKHRPSCTPEGMSYVEQLDLWVDIYLQSGTGATTKSANNAVITDTRIWNDHVDDLAAVGKRLLDDSEFQIAAEGCNQQTNILGSADPNTTGGHVDTASRRMLSNAGLEDCAGVLYQWLRDQSYQYNADGSVLDGAKTAAVTYAASPGGNPVYLKFDKGVPYLCSNLATAAADKAITFSTDYKIILVHDAAAATGGLPVYFDDDATQPGRLLCNNTLLGKNCFIPTNNLSYALQVTHSATAATLGVAVYYDDGADNRLEAANASAANQNLSLAVTGIAWSWKTTIGSKGQLYSQGTYGDTKLLAGVDWTCGAYCGSRGRFAFYCRWIAGAFIGARGRAEPKRSA